MAVARASVADIRPESSAVRAAWQPGHLNVGKYQNGTSYTRVSARHNWNARTPL